MLVFVQGDGTIGITLEHGERLTVNITGAEVALYAGELGAANDAPHIHIVTEDDTDFELADSQNVGIRKPGECETIEVSIIPYQNEE